MSSDQAILSKSIGSSWWNDQRIRSLIFQGLTLGVLGAVIAFIIQNTIDNLGRMGIASGFGFLNSTAGYDISFTLIDYNQTDTHARAFLVGLLNTLLVSSLGIIGATLLGFAIGVLRLSENWLINRLAYCYVEIVRNVPLLLQIIFWWSLFLNLPGLRQALNLGDSIFLSNRGFQVPAPDFQPGWETVGIALAVALAASFVLRRWSRRRQAATGRIFPAGLVSLGLVILLPVLTFFAAGRPIEWDEPVLRGFNFQGGVNIPPELFALWFALTVYTAAFIAEIVRAGIQAVSWGQSEAAYALGLRPGRTMRLVIIPQALRVIVPPLTSQYLNLTKNSSLGVAIGFADMVAVTAGTTLNQVGQAIECIFLTMAVYLTISLSISAFMNWYNRRIALVER